MTRPSLLTLFAAGGRTALRHWRVAVVLWLVLGACVLLSWPTLAALTRGVDGSPFRDSILRGWDSRAVTSWMATHGAEVGTAVPALLTVVALAGLVQFLLTGGAIRMLAGATARPTLRRLVIESGDVCLPTLWALSRFLVTLALWWIVLVGLPAYAATRLPGKAAPPNGPFETVAVGWALVGTVVVFLRVLLRLDLARVALARREAATARGAYRVSRRWLRERRFGALALLLAWLAVIVGTQVAFAHILRWMNPRTGATIALLAVVSQCGVVLAMLARLSLWGSLLAWGGVATPEPLAVPVSPQTEGAIPTASPTAG